MIYDLIVLGGGPAGYLAAERAAHDGLSTVVIEKRSFGGCCLNEGCIPSKALLYSAKIYDYTKHGDKYGVTAENQKIDHSKVVARKNKVVKTLVTGIRGALKAAKECTDKPTAVIAKTVKGKGVSFMENQAGWHGIAPNKEQYEQGIKEVEANG